MFALLGKYKNWIITFVILGAAFGGFLLFSSSQATPAISDRANEAARIEQELVTRLLELRKITLDDSFFNEPAFLSLIDFHQDLLDQPYGREDPFAPIEITEAQIRQGAFSGENVIGDDDAPRGGSVNISPGPESGARAPIPSASPTTDTGSQGGSGQESAADSGSQASNEEAQGGMGVTDSGDAGGNISAPPPPPPPAPGG